jgi:integrase
VPEVISNMFGRVARRAGLPRIRFHDLRHSAATIMLAAGVPVWIVARRLGHKTTEITELVYAHAVPGMGADVTSRMAALMNGST